MTSRLHQKMIQCDFSLFYVKSIVMMLITFHIQLLLTSSSTLIFFEVIFHQKLKVERKTYS